MTFGSDVNSKRDGKIDEEVNFVLQSGSKYFSNDFEDSMNKIDCPSRLLEKRLLS